MPAASKPAKPKAPRKKSVLTERQDAYVEARLDGMKPAQAATAAGFAFPTASARCERSEDVQAALAVARSELSSAAQIKRADVLAMFTEAYDMAKLAAEPASMIGAAREIGKMLGYYEPERIKIELSHDQARLQSKFESLSDDQLLEIAERRALVVDGEYTRVS